jgi:hypothetical protein
MEFSGSNDTSDCANWCRANLEYNMCEDERIVAILGNRKELLEETLRSHRVAVALNPDNTDVLFNTGQVLTSLAEALLESGTQETARVPARALLEEAVDVLTKCLGSQQQEYEQIQAEMARANVQQDSEDLNNAVDRSAGVERGSAGVEGSAVQASAVNAYDAMQTSSTSSEAPGEWATVIEPLTPESILETCTAQLGALTTLLGLYDPSELSLLSTRAQSGLETVNTRIPTLVTLIQTSPFKARDEDHAPGPVLSIGSPATTEDAESSPKDDTLLAAANFQASIAEATYRSKQTTPAAYASQIEQLFKPLIDSFLQANPNEMDIGLVNTFSAYADALMDLASALSNTTSISSPTPLTDLPDTQWTALLQAQTTLTRLSSPPANTILSARRLADVFLARGDTDLFRFRLSLADSAKPAWQKSRPVLIANAGVFYRGARSYAEKAGAAETARTADAKAIVAGVLKEGAAALLGSKGKGGEVRRVLEGMVEEGIVSREDAEGVLLRIEENEK